MAPVDETRNSQLFEIVWQKGIAKIDVLTEDAEDRRFLRALAMGGSVTAESVVSICDAIKNFWGEGSEATATELTQLFSLVMLSQVYRWVKGNPPENMTATIPPAVNVNLISSIFDGNQKQDMDDYLHFDQQFACDLAKHSHLTHVSILLLARTSEICGHKCIDWSKVKFPVVEMTHLVKGAMTDGAPLRNILDIKAMQNSLSTGIQAMMIYYSRA
jgi:hypothetical protein